MWFVTLLWIVIFYQRSFHLVSGYSERVIQFVFEEEQPSQTLIGKIELETGCNYRVSSSPATASLVKLNLENGELKSATQIDREQLIDNKLELVLVCQSLASILVIRISILDINDNSPYFTHLVQNLSIIESAPIGSRFLLPLATDLDFGENGTIASYSLRSHDEDTSEVFRLIRATDEKNGDALFLHLERELDREEKDAYVLEITAYDAGTPSRNGSKTVFITVNDANDNYPIFNSTFYEVIVNDKVEVGKALTTVYAEDKDIGANAKLRYRIVEDPSGQFRIDEETGKISAKISNLICPKPFECRTQNCPRDTCVLAIEAIDQGTPSLSGRTFVNIYLNESSHNEPILQFKIYPASSNVAFISKNTTNGTIVAVVTVLNDYKGKGKKTIRLKSGNEDGVVRLETGNNYAILRTNEIHNIRLKKAYHLEFEVWDEERSTRIAQKVLEVHVRNTDDNPLQFQYRNITIDIPEDALIYTPIWQIKSRTGSESLTYKLDDSALPFTMDELTGILKTQQALKAPNSYDLRVVVSGLTPFEKSETIFLHINVIHSKKHLLVFNSDSYTFFIPENHELSEKIAQIKAFAQDRINEEQIKYELVESWSRAHFRLNQESGELVLKKALDYEAKNEYTFHVIAKGFEITNATRVKIFVQDINDEPPYFLTTEQHLNLLTSSLPGTKLLKLKANDPDRVDNHRLSFVVLEGPIDMFFIEKQWLILKESINYQNLKEVQLIIGAKDMADQFSSNNLTVTIHIISNMTKLPTFTTSIRTLEIHENAPIGSVIEKFHAVDVSGSVRYLLIGNHHGLIEINSFSGELKTNGILDREQYQYISFIVIANGLEGSAFYEGMLHIIDENDNAPVFVDGDKKAITIDAIGFVFGMPVGRVEAIDADEGLNGEVIYEVDSEYVRIDSRTGVFSLMPNIMGNDQIQFKVIARDQGKPSKHSYIPVVVSIQNRIERYEILPRYSVVINESTTVGETIIDLNPLKNSTRFYFSIKNESALNMFMFDLLIDGRLILRYLPEDVAPFLWRELIPVVVKDTLLASEYETLIDINTQNRKNRAPTCPELNNLKVLENSPIGTILGQLQGEDPDFGLNGVLFYRLLDNLDKFILEEHTGILKTRMIFDAEARADYQILYQISDLGNKPLKIDCSANIVIMDVNDSPPIFDQIFYYAEIPFEGGKNLLNFTANDLDTGENAQITYSIRDKYHKFEIDFETGTLSSNSNLTSEQLYNITIIATDHGKPSLSSESFALLRTSSDPNTTPKFKPIESITISEATELGTIVATFEAKAGSAIISYQLIDNSMHFELDPYSGELMLVKPLDYEAAQELSLTIMAKTKTANNTQQIRITITDENDHEPIILTDVFTIQENQPGGSIVGNILVSDMDSGTNAEVELDIIYQIPLGDEFSIQRSNLVANKALDREHIDKYHVMVRARDSGKPPKESRKIVTVLVGDQNELPSCNTMLNFYISSANMPFRQKIQCQDLDEGLNGSLGFHLLNETLANFITLAEDGTLTVHTRPKDPITTLHMIVSDRNDILNKNDPLRTSIEVHVTLINKREENEAILFTQSSYRFKVFLDISIGSMIGLIQTKSQSERQFYLTGMRTKVKTILYGIPFAIDKNSGELRLIHMLTSANEYLLDIVAVDSEGNTKSVQVIIEVDMPPVDFFLIERAFFEFSINESLPVGTVVGNLTLREKTSDVRFKWLKETKDNLPFTIDETSGRITVTNSLDFEQHTFYHAIVEIYTSKRVETVLILFNILNANDNVPTFNSTSLNFFVREGASIGSLIGKANAIDLDSNAQVRYQLIGAPQIATIDAFSGILRVSKEIDHDEAAFYKFKIRATDQAGLFSEVTAYLFIEDTNNHPPLILSSEHKAEIDEGASVGTFVYQFQFMDPDSVHNFNFRIEPQGDPFQQFVIDNEGRVSLANPLDREIMSQYKLTVVLCDDYPPSIVHCIKSRIEITVRDVNDNHPEFESPTTFLVSENAAIGAVVGTLNAFDKDLGINSTILFRITPESLPNNEFFVDPLLGYLEVNTQLDREIVVSYTFIVEAYDSGWPRLFTRQEITVRVIDEDDNGPELVDMLENPIELLENVPIGHRVTCLKYTDLDQDANAAAFFEVVDGNVDQHFRIGSLSGCLYVNSVLDFEKRQAYLLNISMKGFVNDSLESFITINIFIRDINDEQPYFVDGNTIRFNVSKRFQGTYPTSLGLLYAKDRDLGINGVITYSLIDADTNLFAVNSTTGELLLLESFGNSRTVQYEFTVQASDSGSPRLSSSAQVVINLIDKWDDNSPQFIQPYYYAKVLENAMIKSNVLTVKAININPGMDDQIRYSIANSDYVPFSIDYFNGIIKLIETLDYENVKKYVIQIQAKDEREFAENISFVNVTVEVLDVPDNVPAIRNSQFDIYINSNLGIGDIVYIVDACDIDSNTTLQYALSGLDRQYFDIDHFGIIRLSKEFGSQKEFSISVTVADDMAMTTSASFSFYIDSEEAFPAFKQLIEPKITVYENVTDYFIMQFETKNVSNGHRYSIAAGDCFEDFEMDSISGKLFVKHVDRERIPKFHLFIAVSDMNVTPMHTSYIEVIVEILDSNDNKPRFEQAVYKASLKENELKADALLRVTAFDDDLGSNARIHYSIIEGNIGDAFRIDPITGDLRNAIPLDRETIDKYRLIIEARDSGEPPLLDICIVEVSVLDENDNPPRFSKLLNVKISEGTNIGDVVFKIKTTDPDSNENSHNTYSIIAESQEKDIFVINPKTGYITLGKSLDRESQDRYRMKVVVNDGLFSVSTTLTITVTDVNDNAPIFSQPLYTFEIDRNNSSFDSIIGKVSAHDLDSGENSTIQFGISPESALFEVDPLTGEIMVLRSPISFDKSEFHIKVYASDNGVPPKSSVTNVRIVLCGSIGKVSARDLDSEESVEYLSRETIEVSARDLDTTESVENLSRETKENDDIHKISIMPVDHNSIMDSFEETSSGIAPTFRDKNVIFELSRRSKNSTIVGILPVDNTSSSSSSSRKPVFFIENNNFLRVLRESGEITLSNAIGANMNNTFSIEAIVKNSMLRHVPPSICQVQIMLNDYAPTPVFPEETYIVSLNETTSKELLRFNFIMPDDAEFEILSGNDGKLFCISKTGSLTLCGAPTQREHYYTLGLGILSNGYIRSQTTVEIHFTNAINTKFRIYPGNRMAWVRENISPGIRFLRLKPHLDDQQNSNFIFKIVDEEISEFFKIDENSGVLSTKQTFDREKRDAYLIPIAIHRNGITQPEVENITVFIDDVDDNPPEQSPIKVFVFSEGSEFFGDIDQLYPPDEDSINSGACSIADETSSLNVKFGESCAGVFESAPSGRHHIKLHYRENDLLIKYDMELLVTWLNETIIDNAILIEFLGTDRMAAEFLSRLRVSLQEMHLVVSSVLKNEMQLIRIAISILDRYGRVLPPLETKKIAEKFFSKKQNNFNIYDLKIYENALVKNCDSRSTEKGFITLRSKDTIWHSPSSCPRHKILKNQFNFGKTLKNSTIVNDIKTWNCGNETNCGSAFSTETPSLLKMILLCGSAILLFSLILVSLVLGILYIRRQARKDPSKTNNKHNVTDIHLVPTYEASANPKYYTVENYVNEHLYASKQGCLNEAYSQMSTASERSVASSLQSLQYKTDEIESDYHYVDNSYRYCNQPESQGPTHQREYQEAPRPSAQASYNISDNWSESEIYQRPIKPARRKRGN